MKHFGLIFILAISATSCQSFSEKEEFVESAPIVVSQEIGLNRSAARDIATYDFRSLVSRQLNITDTSVLYAIDWDIITDSTSGEVKLRLSVGDNAAMYKKQIEKIYKDFTDKKIEEYSRKKDDLFLAEDAAEQYLYRIETYGIDSIWTEISPTLLKYADKTHLTKTLQQRTELFKPLGKRRIASRRISDELPDGTKGNFCTVTFEYQNRDHEEITMEKVEGAYKFLGYNFIYRPK